MIKQFYCIILTFCKHVKPKPFCICTFSNHGSVKDNSKSSEKTIVRNIKNSIKKTIISSFQRRFIYKEFFHVRWREAQLLLLYYFCTSTSAYDDVMTKIAARFLLSFVYNIFSFKLTIKIYIFSKRLKAIQPYLPIIR